MTSIKRPLLCARNTEKPLHRHPTTVGPVVSAQQDMPDQTELPSGDTSEVKSQVRQPFPANTALDMNLSAAKLHACEHSLTLSLFPSFPPSLLFSSLSLGLSFSLSPSLSYLSLTLSWSLSFSLSSAQQDA